MPGVSETETTVPCRRGQTTLLKTLFGEPCHLTVPSMFLYGHTATGKSLLLNTILQKLQLPHVLVNCVECHMGKLIFEHILNELAGITADSNSTEYMRCDNFNDFIRHLVRVADDNYSSGETVYICLDKVERMRDMDANLLPAFLRLQQLSKLNVCVLMLSEIVWEKFRCGTGFLEPFVIHFPDYSKDELREILSLDAPDDYPADFYKNYINLLLSVFYLVCRNLRELRHMAAINFHKYTEPIMKKDVAITESSKLWRNIEPHLKKALQTVYLREVSSVQWEQMELADSTSALISRSNVELPFYSKFLLIAAYLASYNPAKSDRRFFSQHAAKANKWMKSCQKKNRDRTSNQLLGPKPFPLDRLMAIFYAIVDSKVAPTAHIFSQIMSLVTLGMMAQMASSDQLDSPKYKCLVSLDFIKSIARTVNFEVLRYLYDFV